MEKYEKQNEKKEEKMGLNGLISLTNQMRQEVNVHTEEQEVVEPCNQPIEPSLISYYLHVCFSCFDKDKRSAVKRVSGLGSRCHVKADGSPV